MTTPGWYHAQGDPEGTQRYWNGTQWQGEPTAPAAAASNIEYYAPVDDNVDLGDVATRITLAETDPTRVYTESPYSVTSSSVNVTRRKPLPEGLKNLTVLTCVLKAIPLFGIVASLLASISRSTLNGGRRGRFDPPGLDYGSASATAILAVVMLVFASLIITQARSALKDQASNLFAIALIMLMLDLMNTIGQWVITEGFSAGASLLATVILALQAAVTIWAGIQARLNR